MSIVRFILSVIVVGMVGSHCGGGQTRVAEKSPLNFLDLMKQDAAIKPVVVIGGGVAGLTAANYLLQANIPCLVLEGDKPGGALAQSDSVRNWPGIVDAPGLQITQSLKKQVLYYGGEILPFTLMDVDVAAQPFTLTVKTDLGKIVHIKPLACILAMGAEPNYLHVPGEREYWGKGISNCAVCDGALFKNKTVAVIGGGDSAMVEAAYLAGLAKHVYVLVRGEILRAHDKRKVAAVSRLSNVTFKYQTTVESIHGEKGVVTTLNYNDVKQGTVEKLQVDGVFLAIGSSPNTKNLKNKFLCDAAGYLVLTKGQATSVPGFFAAGDICDPHVKQAVTASSSGCQAALQVKDYLENNNYAGLGLSHSDNQMLQEVEVKSNQPPLAQEELKARVIEIQSEQDARNMLAFSEDKLVVIDVYGSYCIPCQKMTPIVEKLANKYSDDVVFAKFSVSNRKFNVDDFCHLVGTDVITQVPTFLFLKKRKTTARQAGSMSFELFESFVTRLKNI